MSYKRTIEIEGPNENAIESFIHEIKKQADDGSRYGVDIEIRRVDQAESDQEVEFSNDY